MKRYNEQRKWRTCSSLLAVALCFILLSSLKAMAAGDGLETLYDKVCDGVLAIEEEKTQPSSEVSEEKEWLPDADMVIIKDEENLNARWSNKSYTWDISANTMRKTGEFYASAGSQVKITVATDPANAATGIGLDQPNGYLRGVSGSGIYSHTFSVKESGNYCVYVRNESGQSIKATVVVVK